MLGVAGLQGCWWIENRTGWGSEVNGGGWGVGGTGTEGALGSLGQSKSRNDIPSTVKHGEDAVWGRIWTQCQTRLCTGQN